MIEHTIVTAKKIVETRNSINAPPDIVRSNTRSSLDNSRSYYHLTKEKVPKRKSAAAGIACGREGGKGGAKERRLRRLKEKVTSPFSPSLRGIESAATMENPMGLPQWLGKPLTRFTTLPTPLRSPPFSPPTFSLSERKNIGWEYPYRGLRLSIQQFPIFSC